MTVAQLIDELQKLPPGASVHREDNEYNGATAVITAVDYTESASWGRQANTVVLR